MTFKKKENIVLPFCVDVSKATYDQYEKVYEICKLYTENLDYSEYARDEGDYQVWEYLGVDEDQDIEHWDEVEDYSQDRDVNDVDVWTDAQTFINAHVVDETTSSIGSEGGMRVVVYYTDGSTYTNKNVKSVQLKDDSLLIYLDTNGETGFKTKSLDDGVVYNHVFQTEMEYLSISTQHLAGYCIMTKGNNKFWTKQFVPLKANFSVEANVVNKKTCVSGKKYIPHKERVQPTGSGFSPRLTLENYEPQVGDYVVNNLITKEAHDKFVSYHKTDRDSTPNHLCRYTYMGNFFVNSKDEICPAMERDVTHLFADISPSEPKDERVKATSGYTLADGSDSGDYYVGDKFTVEDRSGVFSEDSIVSLYKDQSDGWPLLKLISGFTGYNHCDGEAGAYISWDYLTPLDE